LVGNTTVQFFTVEITALTVLPITASVARVAFRTSACRNTRHYTIKRNTEIATLFTRFINNVFDFAR